MYRARRVLMVALVAMALSADRVVAVAPVLRPDVGGVARTLASRLVVSFRHTIPAARLQAFASEYRAAPAAQVAYPELIAVCHHLALSPFQFRLPPPAA